MYLSVVLYRFNLEDQNSKDIFPKIFRPEERLRRIDASRNNHFNLTYWGLLQPGCIDIGDGYWKQNVLVTEIICCWRFWPLSSPTSTFLYHKYRAPTFKRSPTSLSLFLLDSEHHINHLAYTESFLRPLKSINRRSLSRDESLIKLLNIFELQQRTLRTNFRCIFFVKNNSEINSPAFSFSQRFPLYEMWKQKRQWWRFFRVDKMTVLNAWMFSSRF